MRVRDFITSAVVIFCGVLALSVMFNRNVDLAVVFRDAVIALAVSVTMKLLGGKGVARG